MELKLTEIALNRSKNHIGERTTVQVGIFLLKIRLYFSIEVRIVFSHTNPYNFGITQCSP